MERIIARGGGRKIEKDVLIEIIEGTNEIFVITENENRKVKIIVKGGEGKVEIRGYAKGKKISIDGEIIGGNKGKGRGVLIIKGIVDEGEMEITPAIKNDNPLIELDHSAYIKEIDENVLFYLQSRGISREKGKELMIKSFLMKEQW